MTHEKLPDVFEVPPDLVGEKGSAEIALGNICLQIREFEDPVHTRVEQGVYERSLNSPKRSVSRVPGFEVKRLFRALDDKQDFVVGHQYSGGTVSDAVVAFLPMPVEMNSKDFDLTKVRATKMDMRLFCNFIEAVTCHTMRARGISERS